MRLELRFPSSPTLKSGVYLIRNRYTGRKYIGSAQDFEARWKLHQVNLRTGKHHNRHMQASYDKHGEETFEYYVLERCPLDQLIAREQYWINEIPTQYNVCKVAGSRQGVRNTPEHNAAIAAKARTRWSDPEFKDRMVARLKAAERRKPERTVASRIISAWGQEMTLNEWSDRVGLKRETIAYRLNAGWSVERALSTPARKVSPRAA